MKRITDENFELLNDIVNDLYVITYLRLLAEKAFNDNKLQLNTLYEKVKEKALPFLSKLQEMYMFDLADTVLSADFVF